MFRTGRKAVVAGWKAVATGLLIICLMGLIVSGPVSAVDRKTVQLMQKTAVLAAQGQYAEVKRELERAVEEGLTAPEIIKELVQVYLKLYQEYAGAEELLRQVIEEQPGEWVFYHLLGKTYLYQEQPQQAVLSFQKAVELYAEETAAAYPGGISGDRSAAGIFYDLAGAYLQLADSEKAVISLEKTVQLAPLHLQGNNLLHRLYVENGEYQKAYQIWQADNQLFPGLQDPEVFQQRDRLYRQGLVQVKEDQRSGNIHLTMGRIYRQLLLYDEAGVEFKRALQADPASSAVEKELNEVNLFLRFRRKLQAFFDRYYQQRYLNGAVEEQQIYSRLVPVYDIIAPLFADIQAQSVEDWIEQLNSRIEEKFSTIIKIYRANGALVCSSGSVVSRHQRRISLRGEEAVLDVLIVKNLISNGLIYWMRDGESGIGGWNSGSKAEEIIILADYSYSIGRVLELYQGMKDQISADQDSYKRLLSRDPLDLYYSSSIQSRFFVQEIERLLKQQGKNGPAAGARSSTADTAASGGGDLTAEAFRQLCLDLLSSNYRTSLITHEAQHALDGMSGKDYRSDEKEYRAKLAELIFGNQQYLTLSNLYNPNVGSTSSASHARAENRLFQDMVCYLYSHGRDYPAIDLTANILAQLPELSPEEIQELAGAVYRESYPED